MNRKRIVLVVPGGVDVPGGKRVIPFIHHLVESLASRHDVTVVAVGHDTRYGEWALLGSYVYNIPIGDHSKTDIARVLSSATRAVGRRGRPDVVHGLWANLPGLVAVAAGKVWGAPSVVTVGGGELASVATVGYGGGLNKGTRRLASNVLSNAKATTLATSWMQRHITSAGGPYAELVPLGADSRHFSPGTTTTDPYRLVHVANLNRVKDQDLLLYAFERALRKEPRLTLTVAGADTLDGHHERLAASLGVADRVEFLGYVQHDRLADVIRGAGLHVLTSHHDAGPISVLEAAMCRVPTIGTAVGHVDDFARMDPAAAVAVSGRNPSSLADAIGELVSDEERRELLASNAHRWAAAHDADFTAVRFEQIYRRLTR